MDNILKKKLMTILFITMTVFVLCFIYENMTNKVTNIKRNNYGKGKKTEILQVTVEDKLEKEPVKIEINERNYTSDEMKQIFKKTMDQIENVVLGENKSADHVEKDLNFVSKIPDIPVDITWESSNHKIIDNKGKIIQGNLSSDGTPVEIKGILSCGNQTSIYMMNVMVFPKKETDQESIINILKGKIDEQNIKNAESIQVALPRKINGKKVIWEKRGENKSIIILFLGIFSMILIWFQDKENKEKDIRKKERQMEVDYPDIVNQLSLLMEAGMNVKNAWSRIVINYMEGKETIGIRYAYEEMNHTLQQIEGGKVESECYEEFGQRCRNPLYMKLGSLLSQNLRKGTKGISDLLSAEAKEAFVVRKLRAVKTGEEAGTRLLFPMSLMLIIVLIVIMVPAFLSLSI